MRKAITAWAALAVVLVAASRHAVADEVNFTCALLRRSAEQTIDEGRRCSADSDCVVEFLGCPFGCGTPVNKQAVERIRKDVAEYGKACQLCEYKCGRMPDGVICRGGRCDRGSAADARPDAR